MSNTSRSVTTTSSPRPLGTREIFISAVGLVVSAGTLVGDFTGFAQLGVGFVVAIVAGCAVMIPVIVSACDLAVSAPGAGGIYRYARSVVAGRRGKTFGYVLALLITGTFVFGAAGETVSGAHAVGALIGTSLPLPLGAVLVGLLALVPNFFGVRGMACVTGVCLAVMLGIRWFFGLSGFFGWGQTGEWQLANLVPMSAPSWQDAGSLLTHGLALGFWSFVGIEGACALAHETAHPRRTLPRSLLLALGAILATTLVTGLGSLGGLPLSQWQILMSGSVGAGGESPQLAVGEALYGVVGLRLMALATLTSTLSTLLVAFAAMPRLLQVLAQDNLLPRFVGRWLARTHPRTGVPRQATLALGGGCLLVTLAWGAVGDCLYAAAYLWFVRHLVLHGLALLNRRPGPRDRGAFSRTVVVVTAWVGVVATGLAFAVSFAGQHSLYGSRALMVATVAGGAALASAAARRFAVRQRYRRWHRISDPRGKAGRNVAAHSVGSALPVRMEPLRLRKDGLTPWGSRSMLNIAAAGPMPTMPP